MFTLVHLQQPSEVTAWLLRLADQLRVQVSTERFPRALLATLLSRNASRTLPIDGRKRVQFQSERHN